MTRVDGSELARRYFNCSKIDYFSLYMNLYAAYNAWHRSELGPVSNRDALRVLKQNFNIWHQYYQGDAMTEMKGLFEAVVDFTAGGWPVVVKDAEDWRSMVDFWYKIRCELVHGELDILDPCAKEGVRLAYCTLYVFMEEALRPGPKLFSS